MGDAQPIYDINFGRVYSVWISVVNTGIAEKGKRGKRFGVLFSNKKNHKGLHFKHKRYIFPYQ